MKVSIVGATGYTGVELIRILKNHPAAELANLTSETSAGSPVSALYPHLAGHCDITLSSLADMERIAQDSDVIFVALPHGHAMKVGRQLAGSRAKLIDLGADYRFNSPQVYEHWYKTPHTHQDANAVYGLPELYRAAVKGAKIVANPGCYTTASILALYPLVKARLIENSSIIIDAKSGITGAGRTLKLDSHFCEAADNFHSYAAVGHRHVPEIEQALCACAGEEFNITFTPHLLPVARGILATCYARMNAGVTPEAIAQAFAIYRDEFFVRLLGEGAYPAIKNVRGSNFIDIGWHLDRRTGRITVMSALDNLVKGASGQAVQNMNILFDLDEKTGLQSLPVYP